MLVNISNYTLGVTSLVEAGLESPARIVLRNLLELSWLILVVFSKRAKMIAYVQGKDDQEEYDLYRKHFTPKLEKAHGLEPPYHVKWQEALAMQESFQHVVTNRARTSFSQPLSYGWLGR